MNASIFMISTPAKRKSKFYNYFRNSNFSKHHYPSTCSPNWENQMKVDFRAQLSSGLYATEIFAEFVA